MDGIKVNGFVGFEDIGHLNIGTLYSQLSSFALHFGLAYCLNQDSPTIPLKIFKLAANQNSSLEP